MSTPTAVLSADTHLAPRAWAKHPGLAGDSYYGVQQLVDYCTANDLDLILAGDVFDKTRPDPTTIWHMRTQVDRMERQNLAIYYVQGQHELDRDKPWLNSVSWWPAHVHREVFSLAGIKCYGIDWTPADQIKSEFAAIPGDTDLLVAHQVWLDLMGPRIGESECAFSDVPTVKMILTGDFHRHQVLQSTNRNGNPVTVLSPGPVSMQSIDENPAKFFFVLHDDLTVHAEPLKVRQCFRFDISCKEDLDVFLTGNVETAVASQQGVPEHIAKNIVHVTYNEDVPEAYARITGAVGSRAHLFMVPVRQKAETVTVETERRRALVDYGMEGVLELLVDKTTPLYSNVKSLLNAADPRAQLQVLQTAFLTNRGDPDDRR